MRNKLSLTQSFAIITLVSTTRMHTSALELDKATSEIHSHSLSVLPDESTATEHSDGTTTDGYSVSFTVDVDIPSSESGSGELVTRRPQGTPETQDRIKESGESSSSEYSDSDDSSVESEEWAPPAHASINADRQSSSKEDEEGKEAEKNENKDEHDVDSLPPYNDTTTINPLPTTTLGLHEEN